MYQEIYKAEYPCSEPYYVSVERKEKDKNGNLWVEYIFVHPTNLKSYWRRGIITSSLLLPAQESQVKNI